MIINKENILTYWKIILEASPKSEIFKYIFRRLLGKRKNFDQDVYITSNDLRFNCGRLMNNCTVACSQFESDLSPVFKDISTAVDIGAHIGKHSLELSKTCNRVIAIEPDPASFALLRENIVTNVASNILPLNCAMGSEPGNVTFYRDANYPTSNSITVKKNNNMEEITVVCDTLDNISKGLNVDIDFIKVDVEGGELNVLKGGKETLKRCHPKIVFEAWNDNAAEEIKNYLLQFGYSFIRLDTYNYLAEVKKYDHDKNEKSNN